jgi:hypothetical protein
MLKHIKKHLALLYPTTPMSIDEMQRKAKDYHHLIGMTPEARNLYSWIRQEESIRRERWILIFAIIAATLSLVALLK